MRLCYCPILRTTAAELRGLQNLSLDAAKGILPLMVLTRSQRSKYNPDGRIEKRIEQIKDALGTRPFILDLTDEPSMSNAQIDRILHGAPGGFDEWVECVKRMREQDLNVIPVIHYDRAYIKGVRKQIKGLRELSATLAFRVDPNDRELGQYLDVFSKCMPLSDLILILDARYLSLSNNSSGDYAAYFESSLEIVNDAEGPPRAIVCAFSSFPESVTRKNYGGDRDGVFPVGELVTHRNLQSRGVVAGDYASVHPVRYRIGGGTWIPRIDFLGTDGKFHYYRRRREDGGYVVAAKHVREDPKYRTATPPTWADNEISLAADGEPTGKSPLHWIAVRVNSYITRLHSEFRKGNHIPL